MKSKIGNAFSLFWAELHRRRVIKTTIAYVIGGWVVIEATATIFPLLLLPEWTVRMVLFIVVLAFPIVLLLAWTFDIRRTENGSEPETNRTDQVGQATDVLLPPPTSMAEASVAVLPFDCLPNEAEYRFIADGISVELHSTLSKVARLRVIARRSSFALAKDEGGIGDIAHRLGAQYVVSGSVLCDGDRLRISVTMDKAADNSQIWTRTYDRDRDDLLTVLQEIAEDVAASFSGLRLQREIVDAGAASTENLSAWMRVQRARSYLLDFTKETLDEAVDLLDDAVELDPDYSVARAALGSVLSERIMNGYSTSIEADERRALEEAGLAHDTDSNSPFVEKMCGLTWAYAGMTDRSIRALRRAVTLAPFDFGAWGYMGWALVETGEASDLEELHSIMSRMLKGSPQHPGAPFWIFHQSVAMTCSGDVGMAVSLARESVDRNPRFPMGWMQYANALSLDGDTNRATEALQRAQSVSVGMTPDHYERMIRKMSGSEEFVERRIAGIRTL
jgi:adenylate cyclase